MKASEIASFLGSKLIGEDTEVKGHGSLSNWRVGDVVFLKSRSKKNVDLLLQCKGVFAITPIMKEGDEQIPVPHIEVDNPRLAFIKVVRKFFTAPEIAVAIHPTAVIEEGATIGKNVSIGAHCYIGPKVTIGEGSVILPNVSIYGEVEIGTNCYIKPGAVIGGPGFGFEYDEDGEPLQFPHSGKVIIGNNVYIGANATIDRATMDATIIEDNVKVDNLVHIAHNCRVGKNTLMTGCSTISGGVQVGESCWMAPNSTVYQQLKIGNNSRVGIGAVVLRNVNDNATVFGNPAYKVEM